MFDLDSFVVNPSYKPEHDNGTISVGVMELHELVCRGYSVADALRRRPYLFDSIDEYVAWRDVRRADAHGSHATEAIRSEDEVLPYSREFDVKAVNQDRQAYMA